MNQGYSDEDEYVITMRVQHSGIGLHPEKAKFDVIRFNIGMSSHVVTCLTE